MLNKSEHTQTVTGNNNQTAGGSITNIYKSAEITNRSESAIEKILLGICELNIQAIPNFNPEEFIPYKIEMKIDHNKIYKYKAAYDDFLRFYIRIKHKINLLNETDSLINFKINSYVKDKYIESLSLSTVKVSDDIIDTIVDKIKTELISINKAISLDELSFVTHVVFFVFAECEIFEKPPRDLSS